MKYLYTLFALLLLHSTNSYSQVLSQKLPGINGGNFFSVVEFQDTLYTISFDSQVFNSTDNGATWVKDTRFNLGWSPALKVDKTAYLSVDDYRDQLYIYGSFGLMIYSSGKVTVPETLPEFFGSRGAFGEMVVSDSALYASYLYSPTSRGEILKSLDGGLTWVSHDATQQFLKYLSSTSNGRLIGVSGKKLMLSEVGGTSFTELTIPTDIYDLITDLLVSDDIIYFSSFEKGIQSSNDFGYTWTQIHEETAFSLTELSSNRILAGGLNAHVYISSDGGENWSDTDLGLTTSIFSYQGLKEILELEDGTLVATTVWGDVYNNSYKSASVGMMVSNDNGNSWTASNTGLSATTITQIFKDDITGDTYLFSVGTGVYKWNNEVSSWETVGTPPDVSELQSYNNATPGWNPIGDIGSLSKNPVTGELVFVSKYVTLILDSDTNTWEFVEHDSINFLSPQGLYFTSDGTAIIHESLGPYQGIYTSTDLINWEEIEDNPNGANITNFSAIDGYIAYIDTYAFDDGLGVHYSNDFGSTWTHIQANREGTFFINGYFLDPDKKEVLTTFSSYPAPTYELTSAIEVYDLETKTISETKFTTSEENLNTPDLKDIYRLPNGAIVSLVHDTDPITYIAAPIGYFYNTGDTFKMLKANLPEGAADEVTINGENTLLLRYGADIYEVSISGMSTSNEQLDGEPSTFRLLPNYPNPFNPTTQLQFELNQPSNTKITVYSTAGQVVKEIDMGRLTSGMHSVRFDASSLASGIYLYSVQSGSQIRTGKMTLIK